MTTKKSNPKDAMGVKKAPMSTVSAAVMAEVGVAMLEGAAKYGRHNYRAVGVRASVYYDSTMRHLMSWWEGEDTDPESGMSHITKAITSLVVYRDAMIQGKIEDDRPPRSVNFYSELNKKAEAILNMHADKSPKHYTIEDDILTSTFAPIDELKSDADQVIERAVENSRKQFHNDQVIAPTLSIPVSRDVKPQENRKHLSVKTLERYRAFIGENTAPQGPDVSFDSEHRMDQIGTNGNEGEHYKESTYDKPSWDDAPEWAMWMAQDLDGSWWAFTNKPEADHSEWLDESPGEFEELGTSIICRNWRNTLEPRPTKESAQ